ncbi:MAG: hypothetical protein AMJ81_12170 [Phycisphaerae bacterium SM23_33]|nr:MAG: hypothetical protein AMJ81_12170 [Phycisphaerae bacterium SM23_33]
MLERLEPRTLLSGSTPWGEALAHAIAGESDIGAVEVLPGDANRDGQVDGLDYNLWSDNYLAAGAGWEGGDFNGDGLVDGLDYNIWSQYYQPQPDPAPPDDPVPGSDVTWHTEDLPGGLGLVVLGTDGADAITVSRSGDSTILITPAGTYTLTETFVSVEVYGFGGNDLLVSISGAAEALWGGEGIDSFWADSLDTIADVEAAEAEWNVHQVTEFYQPTDDPAEYVSLELAGQDIVDPHTSSTYADFSGNPLFVDGPEYDDIHQGGVADCYFLAALSSLAQSDPGIIQQMIAPLGDGTYAVRFYGAGQAIYLRIDADLPVLYPSLPYIKYARLSPDGELWVALAEKAYAQFRYGQNSYDSLAYGWMDTAYRQITNSTASRTYTAGVSGEQLAEYIAGSLQAGHAVSAASTSTASDPIAFNHAYVVKSIESAGGQWSVTLYNVHGQDGFDWDGNRYDGVLTISLEMFRQSFSALCVSLA